MSVCTKSSKDTKNKPYKRLECIGQGAFATVYRAINTETGQICALKHLHQTNITDLINEISALESCKSDNIIKFFGLHHSNNNAFIVMEYSSCGSLKDIRNQIDRGFSEEEIRVIVKDVIRGLNYIHSMEKIHRDVKCANILLSGEGIAKLGDFGVSCDVRRTESDLRGTIFWLPPEVCYEGEPQTPLIDIWSLGITIIEMAEMKPPLHDLNNNAALQIIFSYNLPPPTFSEPSKWGPDLNEFLSKCLIKNVQERSSASQLLESIFINKEISRLPILELIKQLQELKTENYIDRLIGVSKENSTLLSLVKERNDQISSIEMKKHLIKKFHDESSNRFRDLKNHFNSKLVECKTKHQVAIDNQFQVQLEINSLSQQLDAKHRELEKLRKDCVGQGRYYYSVQN